MKKLIITTFAIILLLFLISSIIADVQKNPDDPEKSISNLDSVTKTNINNIQNYVQSNFPDLASNPQAGKIIVGVDGELEFRYNDKLLLSVPKGLQLEYKDNKMVVSGKSTRASGSGSYSKGTIPPLIINGKEIGDSAQGYPFYVEFEQNKKEGTEKMRIQGGYYHLQLSQYEATMNGNTQIIKTNFNLDGIRDAEIVIDSKTGKVKSFTAKFNEFNGGSFSIEGNTYNSLKEATVNLDENGKIIYAKLTSLKGGSYNFEYRGKNFGFEVGANGQIEFDPQNKKITGSKIDNARVDGNEIEGASEFKLELNEEGKVISAYVDKGVFYSDKNELVKSKTGGSFYVFLDGRNIPEDLKGKNVISFGDEKVKIQGTLSVEGLRSSNNAVYSYEGLKNKLGKEDPYTEFNRKNSFFDVQKGDCVFNNGQHEVLIQDGQAKVRLLPENPSRGYNPASFGFDYTTKEGMKIQGVFNVDKNEYTVTGFTINGKNVVVSIPFEKINTNPSTNQELIIQNKDVQVSILNSQLKQKEDQISKESDPDKKANLQLEKLKIENQILILNGGSVNDAITKISEFRDLSENLQVRAKAELEIADLMNKKATSIDVPKTYSISNDKQTGTGIGPGFSVPIYTSQKIDFEVDKSGNIHAFYYEGKRIELNGENTEIPSGLAEGNRNAIQNLIDNGASLDNLKKTDERTLKLSGYSLDSTEYKQTLQIKQEVMDLLSSAGDYALKNNDKSLQKSVAIKTAEAYISARQNEEAIKELKKISEDESFSKETRRDALILMATSNFQGSASSNGDLVNKNIYDALQLDLSNSNANGIKQGLDRYYLREYASMASNDAKKTDEEVGRMVGDGRGAWQTTKDIASIMFNPTTNIYLVTSKADEMLKQQGENYDLSSQRYIAATQLDKLNERGVDLGKYSQSSVLDKFENIYTSNNFDSVISLDQLRGYIQTANFDPSKAEASPESLENLRSIILQQHGEDALRQFNDNMLKTLNYMNIIENSYQNDPTLYRIVRGYDSSAETEYNGKVPLSEAFKNYRIGEEIGYTGKEKILLAAGDVLLNPLTYVGIGEVGNLLKASEQVGKQVLSNVAIEGASLVSPELGAVAALADITHGFAKGKGISAEMRTIEDSSSGERSLFAKIENAEQNIDDFAKKVGASKVDKEAKTLTLSDGKVIAYGSELPEAARIVPEQNLIEEAGKSAESAEMKYAEAVQEGASKRTVEIESQAAVVEVNFEGSPYIPNLNTLIEGNPSFLRSKVTKLEYLQDFDKGNREGSMLYQATLLDGTKQYLAVKEINLEKLQEDILRYGPQSSPIVFNKLDYYLTTNEIAQELKSQMQRLKEVNPDWVPYFITNNNENKFIIYSEAYISQNPKWLGGNWKDIDYLTSDDNYVRFLDELKNSNPQIRDKLVNELNQLKQKAGSGFDRTFAISDGHKKNIMVWIKEENNIIEDIEIRPIDCYDPISLYPDHIREAKLKWVDDLVNKINTKLIFILAH